MDNISSIRRTSGIIAKNQRGLSCPSHFLKRNITKSIKIRCCKSNWKSVIETLQWIPQWADDLKEGGMRKAKPLYSHEDWVRHRSSRRHIRHLGSSISSRVILSLVPPVCIFTGLAAVIAAYNTAVECGWGWGWLPVLHASSLPYQLTAPALALLLVFRTEASYSRYVEGKNAWTAVIGAAMDFARQSIAWIRHPSDEHLKDQILRYITAFPFALKEALSAQYIVRQYIAASGGSKALNSIKNLYAMGNVKMVASAFETVKKTIRTRNTSKAGEVGCFVLWEMKPDKWCMELVVAGINLCSGCDGRLVWRQSPWLGSHASRGPPRPLRRSLQGLDPGTAANLFSNARYVGEKKVGEEECFMLKLSTERPILNARSNPEILRHSVTGYFSQKTGLLVQLEDSQLLRIEGACEAQGVYWETKMESTMDDYRTVDGIKVAHSGRSTLTVYIYGEEEAESHRTTLEEVWSIKEVAFNVQGLSTDCFLPPADLDQERESQSDQVSPFHRYHCYC